MQFFEAMSALYVGCQVRKISEVENQLYIHLICHMPTSIVAILGCVVVVKTIFVCKFPFVSFLTACLEERQSISRKREGKTLGQTSSPQAAAPLM